MKEIVDFAQATWNVWLFAIFTGIVIYALWPSKKRKEEMEHAANIPLMDDKDIPAGGKNGHRRDGHEGGKHAYKN